MKRLSHIILLCFFFSLQLLGQETFQPKNINPESKGIIFNKELAFDIKLHTYGFSFGTKIGKIQSYHKTNFVFFNFGELKHAKENRQSYDARAVRFGRTTRSFIFGKQNNLLVVRAGVGSKKYLTEKARKKGLAVGYSYELGGTLGILKPYYLDLRDESPSTNGINSISESYSVENESTFLDISKIYGASAFTKGFNELGFVPGINAKFGAHFDWGAFDEFVKAMEVGIMVDAFIKKADIMVEPSYLENFPDYSVENRRFFINLYITLQLGKRW